MSEEKVVGRNFAVTLGIICMILMVGLVVAIVDYTSILSIKKSTVWISQTMIQPSSTYKSWTFPASYAGYVSVEVESSTPLTYVILSWYAYGIEYGKQTTVGTSGRAVFPVLPCSDINIELGYLTDGTTVTITYYY
jgi:hypothetical protein